MFGTWPAVLDLTRGLSGFVDSIPSKEGEIEKEDNETGRTPEGSRNVAQTSIVTISGTEVETDHGRGDYLVHGSCFPTGVKMDASGPGKSPFSVRESRVGMMTPSCILFIHNF